MAKESVSRKPPVARAEAKRASVSARPAKAEPRKATVHLHTSPDMLITVPAASGKSGSVELRAKQVLDYVVKTGRAVTNWMAIFNTTFGPGGKVDELFPTEDERIAFTKTPQCREIFDCLGSIRDKHGDASEDEMAKTNASGAFNLRLPKVLHAALVHEADEQGVSLNQLCLAKLAVQLRRAVK